MNTIFYHTDFYKVGHVHQYPEGTSLVVSNFTARKSLLKGIDQVYVYGVQEVIDRLVRDMNHEFFEARIGSFISCYKSVVRDCLGDADFDASHIQELHKLGYLPLEFRALPEGTLCPIGTPVFTVHNTDPRFFWLTNYFETLLSNEVWHPMTCATIAYNFRKILDRYAEETSSNPGFVDYQAHDFSMRGHVNLTAAVRAGVAHLQFFKGSDTIPAILQKHLLGRQGFPILSGGSVPATEHSVMCAGGKESELQTFERLLNIYPKGVLSVVSDTWDLWKVITEIIPQLKDKIMSRDGKLVIRPDSGDPVKILCGDPEKSGLEGIGVVRLLWDLFGGTVNSKGFKELDSHIGVIYGDSITLERCEIICQKLKELGFASTNVVFGVGSFTYQYLTRDSLGFAMKATYAEINGVPSPLFKNPITDSGFKKSHKGLIFVNEDLTCEEGVSLERFLSPENKLKKIEIKK